ncbi:MAG: hypothetical protein DRP46_08385 [Candidatus Zixiibacteriota bacterium]|nr:MAG: hypothetical protein DRP46_08385 [candidate division Zixibacteria bacterium]
MARIYKRNRVWYLDIRHKGKRIRKKVGKSRKIAELALKDTEIKIARDEYGFTKKDIKIEELIDRFLDYNKTNNRDSTTKRYIAIMNHLQEFIKEKRPEINYLSQLSDEIIEEYKSFRKNSWVNPNGQMVKSKKEIKEYTRKGARSRTINLEVDGIKTMLNLAVRWQYLVKNPLTSVKSLKEDDRKPIRFLSENECKKFLEACPKTFHPIFFTLLHTGMRKAEIENLQWQDIDLKNRKILIRRKPDWNPKTSEREIPLSDALYKVLSNYRKRKGNPPKKEYAFNLKNSGHSHNILRRVLIKTAKRAEIENFTKVHTLRHTFASHLVVKGIDLPTVGKLLGHTDIQTTMVYAHLAPNHLVDAVNKITY